MFALQVMSEGVAPPTSKDAGESDILVKAFSRSPAIGPSFYDGNSSPARKPPRNLDKMIAERLIKTRARINSKRPTAFGNKARSRIPPVQED